jgi:hypothetical protein
MAQSRVGYSLSKAGPGVTGSGPNDVSCRSRVGRRVRCPSQSALSSAQAHRWRSQFTTRLSSRLRNAPCNLSSLFQDTIAGPSSSRVSEHDL